MRDYIHDKVVTIKKIYKTNDPFELADVLGVTIAYRNNFKILKGYFIMMNGYPYIVVNANLDFNEQRMIVAHELGHYLFHKEIALSGPLHDTFLYDMKSTTEYEANMFAADFLVDDETIDDFAQQGFDYYTMCGLLMLSPEMTAFKLYNMIQRGYKYNLPQSVRANIFA